MDPVSENLFQPQNLKISKTYAEKRFKSKLWLLFVSIRIYCELWEKKLALKNKEMGTNNVYYVHNNSLEYMCMSPIMVGLIFSQKDRAVHENIFKKEV